MGLRLVFCCLLSCDGMIVHTANSAACVEDGGNRGFREN